MREEKGKEASDPYPFFPTLAHACIFGDGKRFINIRLNLSLNSLSLREAHIALLLSPTPKIPSYIN